MDITRPRISGADPSCTVVLAVEIQAMLKNPIGSSTIAASTGLSRNAITSELTPKPTIDHSSRRCEGLPRLAAVSAPATEPAAITEASTPYRLGPPW